MDLNLTSSQTLIFSLILVVFLAIGAKKTELNFSLTKDRTTELKGFAILAIILAHIGYFLVSDHSFLFPLSILAGTGVNLFLFLSGYGLIASSLKSEESISSFYKRRLIRLFIPLWLILTITLIADKLVHNINYPLPMTAQNYLGFFSSANPKYDLNSPLWYFSLILYYYLLFPIFLNRKKPYISAILLTIFSLLLINIQIPATVDIFTLYKLHFLAFPLGIFTYYLFNKNITKKLTNFISKVYPILIIITLVIIPYTAIHSNVGGFYLYEQLTSLVTMFSIIILFILLPVKFNLFKIFGVYSYEIYLIHWPILSRYDPLYMILPLWIATILSLGILFILGLLFQKINQWVLNNLSF